MRVHCRPTRYQKTPTFFSPSFCAPLAQGVKILTSEIWVRPTYACKILSGFVKVCRSYSRKADFEYMHDSVQLDKPAKATAFGRSHTSATQPSNTVSLPPAFSALCRNWFSRVYFSRFNQSTASIAELHLVIVNLDLWPWPSTLT